MTDYLKKIAEIRKGDLKDFIEVRDPEGISYLEDEVTAGVLREFMSYCQIPHGTHHEKEIAQWLADRFEKNGWKTYIDEGINMVCDIPATPGYENVPIMAIQGHTDMVCAFEEGSAYDPLTDSIKAAVRRDEKSGRLVLSSDGTTSLGADCGMGNAAAVYLLEDETLVHGPIRLILTAREEIGLVGVKDMAPSSLDNVAVMANVDGFDCLKIVAGSASGRRVTYGKEIEAADSPSAEEYAALEISVAGLKGGHSGFDIHIGRANAVKELFHFLYHLQLNGIDYRIASFKGGLRHNVIPVNASAVIVAEKETVKLILEKVDEFKSTLKESFEGIDDDILLSAKPADMPEKVVTESFQKSMMHLLSQIISGVYRYMDDMPGVPHTSANLGEMACDAAEKLCEIGIFERSMGGEVREVIAGIHDAAALETGFKAILMDGYEPWVFNPESRFLAMAAEEYSKVSGVDTEIKVSHVGLEPSVFGEYNSETEMICIGTDIIDAHSVSERVNLDTVKIFTLTLRNIIERYAAENR